MKDRKAVWGLVGLLAVCLLALAACSLPSSVSYACDTYSAPDTASFSVGDSAYADCDKQ